MANITTPVKGFTGKVIGVAFADGKAETKDDAQIAYFRRHGYDVDTTEDDKAEAKRVAAEAKKAEEAAKVEADRLAEEKAAADKAAADAEAAEKAKK